jgi:hypothetical protein
MTNKNEHDTTANDWFKLWNQSMSEMMAGMLRLWHPESGAQAEASGGGPAAETETGRQVRASVDAALKNWQAVSTAMTAPESMEALFKGVGGMPEMLARLARTSLNSFLEMQAKALERIGKVGEHVDAYTFADMDESMFRAWTEMYEKEFSRYFQIPKLGLVREYQERVSRSLDAYNRYQAALNEFLRLLALPVSRSFAVLQDQLGAMAEEGQLPEDGRAYYELWVKVLEGHYMTLFQTPEYVETLSKTLSSLSAFQNARNAVIEDLLAGLPVPTRTEIDALYEEVHRLKRRLRTLEKDKG